MKRFTDRLSPLRRGPVCTWSGSTSSYLRYPLPQWSFYLFFFFFSRIPQLQNTSSMSLIATVHLNIQIPQLVTLILNTSFLLLYLSIPHQIFIHHKYTSFFDSCVTVQYMSHNSRTKDHGTVSSRNKICVMVIFHLAALNSFRFVESTVNCLVNFAFYHQETKYSDESIVPKWSLRVLCQTGLASGPRCCRRQTSLDHYIRDTNVKSERLRINPCALIGCT